MAGGETFALVLATAATPEALEGWMADAVPGERAIYAQGIDLPREAEGVKLVQRWTEQGLVVTHHQRDPFNQRRWQYLIIRKQTDAGAARRAVDAATRTADEKRRVFRAIGQAAREGRTCPSNAALARLLGLPTSERGRQRARYLVERLQLEGAIEVVCQHAFAGREVVILKGPWRGCRTAKPITGG